jgi:hypothetical protein
MAKTAKRKRKPKRAPAKRDRIVDLLDIRSAKGPRRPPTWSQKKEMVRLARRVAQGLENIGAATDHLLTPLALPDRWVRSRAEEMPSGQRRKAGAKPKYDWDAIQAHSQQRFYDLGYPSAAIGSACRSRLKWQSTASNDLLN